jgi:hypothetical protein
MIQGRCGPGLLLEPAAMVIVGKLVAEQNLDSNEPAEARIYSLINLAHSSRTKR